MRDDGFQDDDYCYVCGRDNPRGFRLRFERPAPGRLAARVVFSREHQGFKGVVHGGFLAAVLDDIMVNVAWLENCPAVTGELRLRLKRPAKVGEVFHAEAWVTKTARRLVYVAAAIKDAQGRVVADAEASCVRLKGIDLNLTALRSKLAL